MVPGARAGGAYLLLPAPETPPGGLYCAGTGTAGTAGRSSSGSKAGRKPCQAPTDHQDRNIGDHGCGPFCSGPGIADDAPC